MAANTIPLAMRTALIRLARGVGQAPRRAVGSGCDAASAEIADAHDPRHAHSNKSVNDQRVVVGAQCTQPRTVLDRIDRLIEHRQVVAVPQRGRLLTRNPGSPDAGDRSAVADHAVTNPGAPRLKGERSIPPGSSACAA